MNSQNKELLEYLKEHITITQRKASRVLGIDRLSARVFDLRHDGHMIITNMITVKDRHGRPRRVAEYVYLGEVAA